MSNFTPEGLPVVSKHIRQTVEERFLNDYLNNDDFSYGRLAFENLKKRDNGLFVFGSTMTTHLPAGLPQRLSWIVVLGIYQMLDEQNSAYGGQEMGKVSDDFVKGFSRDSLQRAMKPTRAQQVDRDLTDLMQRENPEVLTYVNRMKRLASQDRLRFVLEFNGKATYEILQAVSQANGLKRSFDKD